MVVFLLRFVCEEGCKSCLFFPPGPGLYIEIESGPSQEHPPK